MPIVYTEKAKKMGAFLSNVLKIGFCLAVVGTGWYGYTHNWVKYFDAPLHQEASVPKGSSLTPAVPETAPQAQSVPLAQVPKASSVMLDASNGAKIPISYGTIPWIAAVNAGLANGGAKTKPGSLMDKAGVFMTMQRYENYTPMQTGMLEFAQAYHDGKPNPTQYGMQFGVLMHNGTPMFLAGINEQLKRFGPDYVAEIIAPIGRSLGEDKFMVTPEIFKNPQLAIGKFFGGEKGDGDQDLGFEWFRRNNIPVNVDETVYNPHAANWVSASFTEVVRRWNVGDCGAWRPTLGNPEKKVQECLSGLGTWLPGDQQVSDGRGGLVTALSTKDYPDVMTADLVGIRKWNAENRALVDNLLLAFYQAGELIKTDDAALFEAGRIAAEVFGEGDAKYWQTYYKGKLEKDKQGLWNEIGGSYTFGLADALESAGLLPGTSNKMAENYDGRGAVTEAMYPDFFPNSFPKAAEAINYSYLKDIQGRIPAMTAPVVPVYSDAQIQEVVGNQSWNVTFATSKATFDSRAISELEKIWHVGVQARGLKIAVYGHTDNVGGAESNKTLSMKRAQAVVDWLKHKSPDLFPSNRFTEIKGYGEEQPIASNDTEAGRSENRRVQIVLGR